MSGNNRYSLIVKNNDMYNIIEIDSLLQDGSIERRKKVSLVDIDLLTTKFTSKEELLGYFDLPIDTKVMIKYQVDGTQKFIPCIYSGNKCMCYFASVVGSNRTLVDIDDSNFNEFLSNFFIGICKPSFRDYFMNCKTVNSYIKRKIDDYIESNYSEEFILKKLKCELQKYKSLRDVVLTIGDYEKLNGCKILNLKLLKVINRNVVSDSVITRFIPSDELEEPLFPPNSEEEQMYNEYMDNLPDDYPCHEEHKFVKSK